MFTKERRDEVLGQARAIAEKAQAEGRGLTAPEQTEISGHIAEAKGINDALQAEAQSKDLMGQLDAMARSVKGAGSRGTLDDGRRMSFGKAMVAGLVKEMIGSTGSKALAPSGAAVVGQEFQPDPVALGRVATNLLDVLPVIQHLSPNFAYLRQGIAGRTNNAAVVAEGAVKPTSPLGVDRVENALAVVAHLSELTPRYWLLDNESLQRFVADELAFGLGQAVERKVIADVNGTSGIQTQAFSTSSLITIRKSLTKLEGAGLIAGAIVLHPTAWEGVELSLASTNAVEHLALPYDPANRRLYGVPVVTTISEDPAVCHVLSVDAVVLDTDTNGVQVQWSENSTADSFARNQIQARCEGRFATSVFRPMGVVKAALAA